MTFIGEGAFDGWDIPEVISKIENPFNISTTTFTDNTFYNSTLYVPKGTIDKYRATEGWKKFLFIEEGDPSGIERVLSKDKLIQNEGGMLTVQNIKKGTLVNVYNANGTQVGSAISQSGQATIDTNLQPGSVAIVKICEESVKVMIK